MLALACPGKKGALIEHPTQPVVVPCALSHGTSARSAVGHHFDWAEASIGETGSVWSSVERLRQLDLATDTDMGYVIFFRRNWLPQDPLVFDQSGCRLSLSLAQVLWDFSGNRNQPIASPLMSRCLWTQIGQAKMPPVQHLWWSHLFAAQVYCAAQGDGGATPN